jgi:hypothetical protein
MATSDFVIDVLSAAMGMCSCPEEDRHTQIAAGLEQLVILTRVTFRYRDSLSCLS